LLFYDNCLTGACLACTVRDLCNTCAPERGPHSIWQLSANQCLLVAALLQSSVAEF